MSTIELALRIFIVDDEPPARNRLRELLSDCNEQLPQPIARGGFIVDDKDAQSQFYRAHVVSP